METNWIRLLKNCKKRMLSPANGLLLISPVMVWQMNCFSRIKEREITVDILVNNAGFGNMGQVLDNWAETFGTRDAIEYGNAGAVNKVFCVWKWLIAVVGKSSMLPLLPRSKPGPLMAIYYATKSFVVSFSEALSKELQGTGITITALCPGPTETEFQQHAGLGKMHLFKKVFLMDARTVAECAYDGLIKGKRIVITGSR